jgi:hypothetical protein
MSKERAKIPVPVTFDHNDMGVAQRWLEENGYERSTIAPGVWRHKDTGKRFMLGLPWKMEDGYYLQEFVPEEWVLRRE